MTKYNIAPSEQKHQWSLANSRLSNERLIWKKTLSEVYEIRIIIDL